ncbi:MAG: DUF2569 domain-containing protein, partial [Acidobacteriota bacterium]
CEGIGGWLIWIVIGLIATPVILFVQIFHTYLPLFTSGAWQELTSAGSSVYHPVMAGLVVFEMVSKLFFAFSAIGLLALMLRESRRFPSLMILFFVLNLVYVASDMVLTGFLQGVPAEVFNGMTMQLVKTSLVAMLWIPYFVVSNRVRQTFVN